VVALGSAMMLYRPISDRGAMNPDEPAVVTQALATGGKLKREYEQLTGKSRVGHTAENLRRFMDNRRVWPYLMHDAADALAATNAQPDLLGADVMKIKSVPPATRRLVELSHLDGAYDYQADTKSARPIEFLNDTVGEWLRQNAEREGVPYRILADTISYNPTQWQTWRVTETGEQQESGTSRSSSKGRGGSAPPSGRPGRDRPKAPPAPPPPPDSGPSSPGGFGAGGGPELGRRDKGRSKRNAPGKGGSGFGTSSGGGGQQAPSDPRSGRRQPPRPGSSRSSGTRTPRGSAGEHGDLDSLGPVPDRPSLYPVDAEYYVIPITFEVELVDERAPASRAVARADRDKDPAS